MIMKNLKKIIIIVSIITIILILIIVIIKILENNYVVTPKIEEDEGYIPHEVNVIQRVYSTNDYFNAKRIIENFLNYMSKDYLMGENADEDYKQIIIDNLSKTYISNNNITIENINEKIPYGSYQFIINDMYFTKAENNNNVYLVLGTYVNLSNSETMDYGFIVRTNLQDEVFSIALYDEIENMGIQNAKAGDSISFTEEDIEKNEYNLFTTQYKYDDEIANEYFLSYKQNALFNPEHLYDMLDEEYKNTKFEDESAFLEYLQKNRNDIMSTFVSKYRKETKDGKNRYICIDNYGNYYIFNEEEIMNYTAILDIFTVNTEEFMAEYDSSNEEKKVALNIEKIIQAINVHDYKYVYNKLDETFRNNNWGSEEAFEQYMRDNFPLHYDVEYTTYSNEGATYVQQINLTDITGENEGTISLNIIMQLKDNYEFVMSFSVQE